MNLCRGPLSFQVFLFPQKKYMRFCLFQSGLEKTQVLQAKQVFLMENVHVWGLKSFAEQL